MRAGLHQGMRYRLVCTYHCENMVWTLLSLMNRNPPYFERYRSANLNPGSDTDVAPPHRNKMPLECRTCRSLTLSPCHLGTYQIFKIWSDSSVLAQFNSNLAHHCLSVLFTVVPLASNHLFKNHPSFKTYFRQTLWVCMFIIPLWETTPHLRLLYSWF